MAAPEEGTAAVSFVGRDRELARAVGLLDQARAGRGRLLVCTGEAGIGKTRLAEETAAVAAARGVTVAWARSSDRDIAPPYGLWRLALQDLPGLRRGKSGPDLWSLAFGEAAGRVLGSDSELDRGQRFALFSEVRERLARAAEHSGLLLVLDDIQWADEPSLLLLAHLVRHLRGVRMLILATCREPTPPGDRSGELIRQLSADANTERAMLTGLPPVAVAALLAALPTSGGQAASPEQAQAVHAETGGNPFLVRELARMRAERPGATPGSVPGTVLDVTSYRIAQLVPASQDVLRAAAVAGNSFSVGVVAQMLGTAVLALLDPVDECQAAGFLVAGDRPGDYRFSHALVRSAVVARELADLAICVGRMQAPVARWHMLQYSATHAYATGRYAAALRLAGEAFQVMTDMGHPSAFGGYGAVMSPIAMHIGFEASGVTEFLAQIPPHFLPGGSDADAPVASMLPTVNLALMWLERGDRDQAARMYELVRPVRSWHAIPSLRLIAWAQGLAAAIGLARTDDIAYLAEQFEPLRGRHVASGAGAGSYLGPVELHLGKAAAALGALEAAIGDLETAAGICEQIGEPGFAVEARVELAAALARRGAGADTDRARTLLAAAAPDAQRLGMAPFSQRIEGLRARLPTGTPPLSPREREVARLVEQGLTNRQIAAALYVSERTAQNHVQHILDKLGFANRSQIAVWSSASPAPPAE